VHSHFDVKVTGCGLDTVVVGKKIAYIHAGKNGIVNVDIFNETGLLTWLRDAFGEEKWYDEELMYGTWLILHKSY